MFNLNGYAKKLHLLLNLLIWTNVIMDGYTVLGVYSKF